MHRRLALVRRPSPRLAEGLHAAAPAEALDPELAQRQWVGYLRALQSRGWGVVEAPPADSCPDGAFIEDQVFVYGDLALVCRSGAPSRRVERVGLIDTMRSLGYRVETVPESATLDGGDILKHAGDVWVGVGGRTDDAGFARLAELLEPFDVTCRPVPTGPALHLKSAVTVLPDNTLIGWRPALAALAELPRFMSADEPTGANVVLLGGSGVLIPQSAPVTAERLRARRLDVVTVDIGEFEKLDGGVTCLSVRLRG
jgi:dimethylargininase